MLKRAPVTIRSLLSWLLIAGVAAAVTATVPAAICRTGAGAWRRGADAEQLALARGVGHWVGGDALQAESFTTGDPLFDAEWLFGTYMMAAMGFGQVAAGLPDGDPARGEMLARMDRCLVRLGESDVAAFDTGKWGESALATLEDGHGHAAYLGYYDLALALRTRLGPHPLSSRAEAISAALAQRLDGEGLIETYPGERYPVDMASGVAAIGVLADARERPRPPVVAAWLRRLDEDFIDADSGLLIQSLRPSGRPLDAPRGSGTALASYFLSFIDPQRARSLHQAAERSLGDQILGFGALHEYPDGHEGTGDIDSGPLIVGYSISATGFALAGAKRYGAPNRFAALWATTRLFGLPRRRGRALHFATGGPLGDAILFAMLTARSEP